MVGHSTVHCRRLLQKNNLERRNQSWGLEKVPGSILTQENSYADRNIPWSFLLPFKIIDLFLPYPIQSFIYNHSTNSELWRNKTTSILIFYILRQLVSITSDYLLSTDIEGECTNIYDQNDYKPK
jgi:hypothetical protein